MVSKERKQFYNSARWNRCRLAYLKKRKYICERCGEAARIVHHKTYITDENLYDPTISLDENNLEALCLECHNREHEVLDRMIDGSRRYHLDAKKKKGKRYVWDENGHLTPL